MSEKNNIESMFLIANYFTGVSVGLSFFAFGLGSGLLDQWYDWYIGFMVAGLAIFLTTFWGHFGAANKNKKCLDTYSFVMTVFVIFEISQLIALRKGLAPGGYLHREMLFQIYFVVSIFIASITMFSTLLAYTLGGQIRLAEKRSTGLGGRP